MTTRTDYLSGADLIDYRIMNVLYGWISNEINNLEAFINNPAEHVNYNKYIILDFTKLNNRLTLLQGVASNLNIIIQYKEGNPSYTDSMMQSALDAIPSIIFDRLLEWLNQRYVEMTKLIQQNGDPNNVSPLQDYVGMFTFDSTKFLTDYNIYGNSLSGTALVVSYKVENGM